uniref:Uncharacterized protein n=2 Tax=Oryza sativa subsp. japonica TaxID=39947 RepID=Q10SX5_ORYSJ|nr:Hypothetical protein [Oryza sativa Japonica Group]ABF93561.1 transposon protein, putative, unclassified [Oryza sativa Japonica Group]
MEEGHGLRRHKRRRLVGQQAATTQLVEEVDDQQQQQQEEEAPTCSICLQPWTCNGDHRIWYTPSVSQFAFPVDMFTADRAWRSGWYMFFNAALDKQSCALPATNQLVTILSMQCPQCGEELEPHRITNLYAPGINIWDGCCKNHANEVGEYYNREYEGLKTQMESTIAKQGKDLEELDVLVKSVGRQFESLESSLKTFLLSMTERMKMMATQLPAAMDLVQYLEKDVHDIISALSQKPPYLARLMHPSTDRYMQACFC